MQNLDFYTQSSFLYKNTILFTSNNKIYKFNRSKKTLEVLFDSHHKISNLIIHDHKLIFKSRIHKNNDIFMLNLKTEELKQLTYFDNPFTTPLAFENDELIFTTNIYSPNKISIAYAYNIKTHETIDLNISKIHAFLKINNDIIVQKHEYGKTTWKNYQGGLRGVIYKNDKVLIDLIGQSLNPIYCNERIYFIYNENDNSSIVSCNLEGKDLQYHYTNKDYLISNIHNKEDEIVFSIIGNIFIYNIKTNTTEQIIIQSKKIKTNKYQSINHKYITSFDIGKDQLVLAIRGNIFEKHLYSGGFNQISNELRFTHAGYLNNKLFAFKTGKDAALYLYKNKNKPEIFQIPSQIIKEYTAQDKYIVYSNHKNELKLITLEEEIKENIIDKADEIIVDFEISKDNKWIVYSAKDDLKLNIKLYSITEQKIYTLIADVFNNHSPSFDPLNRFIVFLSDRDIKTKADQIKFDYYFEGEPQAYYFPLKPDFNLLSPWNNDEKKEKIHEITQDDLNNIQNKITKLNIKNPVSQIFAINDDKIIALEASDEEKNNVIVYNLKTLTQDTILEECQSMFISLDKQTTIFVIDNKIKLAKSGEKPEETGYKNITIDPNFISRTSMQQEFKNIFEELNWLIQEFYWDPSKAEHLKQVTLKYKDHINRVNTKTELYEILNQMQSEMKTSHAYIFAELKKSKKGSLCCDVIYKNKQFIISNILNNYYNCEHPLYNYNLNIKEGDIITKINNISLNKNYTYEEALLNKANEDITIEIKQKNQSKTFNIKLSNTKNEMKIRYLDWINKNSIYISNQSEEKIGYVHVPSMSANGLKQFFLQYSDTYKKDALIIDIRYNTGGHVSSILLEQLYKKQLGFDRPRHNQIDTIPLQSTKGNYVLLINAYTASDGEIFTESFKQLKLGKVFGERTWGGVVGIAPRHHLIDNLLTSQPEFNTEFFSLSDKSIENYGATPDIAIEDIWNQKPCCENDKILNEAIQFCKKNYI